MTMKLVPDEPGTGDKVTFWVKCLHCGSHQWWVVDVWRLGATRSGFSRLAATRSSFRRLDHQPNQKKMN